MSPKPKANSVQLNVFFSPVVVEQLKQASSERGMSVSGLIRMIVMDWLRGCSRE